MILSPYVYVADNPISFVDIDGKKIVNPLKMVLSNKRFIKRLREFDRELAKVAKVNRNSYKLIITGGDRYKKNGKIFSRTYKDKEVKGSVADSYHLQENGALAVDLRESKFTDKQIKKAAEKAGLQFVGGYKDGHIHLEYDSKSEKEKYLNNTHVDNDHVPSDYELNNDESGKGTDQLKGIYDEVISSLKNGNYKRADAFSEIFNELIKDEKN